MMRASVSQSKKDVINKEREKASSYSTPTEAFGWNKSYRYQFLLFTDGWVDKERERERER